MTRKEDDDSVVLSNTTECCMCGDPGLSSELFRCRVCLHRSQHRYCSNQYPTAEFYRVCNWCLNKEGESTKVSQNSSLSCTTNRKYSDYNSPEGEETKKKKIKISTTNRYSRLSVKVERNTCEFHVNSPIKKERRSPSDHNPSPMSEPKKLILPSRITKEDSRLRRTKSSEDFLKPGTGRQVLRGRVRRYKLLEDVSMQ